ncbi:MAG TPA: class I SAM-dependent methyltransferase [Ilumatobacteraceae bacterium]|nr:class I SAM-dependent methyltransferase [Ilumatobacteraceae bacterium]
MTDVADPDRLKLYSFAVFTQLNGAVTAGMIHLGDRLGLYAAMAAADTPLTSDELAERTGLSERWVREWAYNQAAARLVAVDVEADPERFWLTPEATAVLATPDHPAFGMGMFHRFPQTMAALEVMPESFTTGLGHDYDSHGPEGAVGIERSFEPWNRHHLIPTVLPALDGIVERLEEGITVADVGCGAGGAVLLMAEAFPNSTFVGYDISQYALERAEHRRREDNATNVSFVDPRVEPLPADHSVDFVTTFDCIHDMTDPQGMIHAIGEALAPDGTWLLVDIKGRETFAENVEKNPMASLMYGISVLSCMSSALSEPGGAGLGTLGLPESRAREMAAAAGLSRFRTLGIDHSVNAFYEIRP